jgi:ceramide glucosyltransferase
LEYSNCGWDINYERSVHTDPVRYRFYSSKPKPAISPTLKLDEVPHITILRPVKGLEPQLYECLASTFRQEYPSEKLTIYFCVGSADDPAYPVLQCLLTDFPKFDAKLFVEEEDPNLSGHGGETSNLGPNPKIRNMSRGYREAKGDVIWIIDCNVWVGKGVAGRMVDKLCGYKADGTRATPYKFVHQLPLVVDSVGASAGEETRGLLTQHDEHEQVSSTNSSAYDISFHPANESRLSTIFRTGGGRLEEMFMASSHAKFYTAINTVSIAPCIVGKSNMFRRSHLDYLTSSSSSYSPGIDFFSENICEDHLIGDLLWRKKVPGGKHYNHGLVFGDLAIQPMAGMSVREYIGRRVRWLRVRKWTVTLATLVEPGVEPLLCSAYGSFGTTTLPFFHSLGIPQTWLAFCLIWLSNVLVWVTVDSFVYAKLHSGSSIEIDEDTPSFAQPPTGWSRRSIGEWLAAWIGREVLALPIWSWACLGGTTVMWRGKKFRVGLDMRVVEIKERGKNVSTPEVERARSKDRVD